MDKIKTMPKLVPCLIPKTHPSTNRFGALLLCVRIFGCALRSILDTSGHPVLEMYFSVYGLLDRHIRPLWTPVGTRLWNSNSDDPHNNGLAETVRRRRGRSARRARSSVARAPPSATRASFARCSFSPSSLEPRRSRAKPCLLRRRMKLYEDKSKPLQARKTRANPRQSRAVTQPP